MKLLLEERKRVTLKYIKDYVRKGYAEDITEYSYEQMRNFLQNHSLIVLAVSSGIYGVTGCIVQDYDTGNEFAVTKCNSNLLQLV